MASPEVLDFSSLLAEIDGNNPAGVNLRADPSPLSDYRTIRSDRTKASEAEKKLDQGDVSAGPADWRPILKAGSEVLATKSKDLEIASIFIEALVRQHGFAGLRDGFRLAQELINKFWEHLYPPAEDADVELRFSHLLWLNGIDKPGTLIVPVRKIPFTRGSSEGNFSLAHYQQALALSQMSDARVRQKKIDDGAVTLEKIQTAVSETPAKFYADLLDDIAQSQEQFQRFCAALQEKSGYDPSGSDLKGVLDAYLDVVQDLARDKLPKVVPGSSVQSDGPTDGSPQQATPAAGIGESAAIKDRNDAMDRLVKIAAFFREREPQSIVPYALEQVVSWCRMPLPELLSTLIPEEAPRNNLFKQLGISPPEVKK